MVLDLKSRALHVLNKQCIRELCPQIGNENLAGVISLSYLFVGCLTISTTDFDYNQPQLPPSNSH